MTDHQEAERIPVEEAIVQGQAPDPALPNQFSDTDWWIHVIANTNRMAMDEKYRKVIAKDIA